MSGPFSSLDQWDDFVKARYNPSRARDKFRQFDAAAPASVHAFYRENHTRQTVDFVLGQKARYAGLTHGEMGVWEAMERLDALVDDSDPDTDLSQIEHCLQTAEAIRRDGRPRWFILAGLVHDLGKVLCLFGEPQWAVVGDTFPVGCAWSDTVVFPEYFSGNPDNAVPEYRTRNGLYSEECGLDRVHLSWGHDEYIYLVTRDFLPEEAQYMLRYHSFYSCHREGAYAHLMNTKDRTLFRWVREFNPYDLYSKSDARPDAAALRPFYEDLIAEYFPARLRW